MHKSKRMALLVFGCGCLLAAAGLLVTVGLPERAAYTGRLDERGVRTAPEVGAQAPAFATVSADGSRVALDDLRGRAVVLNFWATWCGPCRVEMPELEALYASFGPDRLAVIGLNTGEDVEDVLDWAENYGLTFPLALDADGTIAQLYALRGQPTTFVIAPNGEIVQIYYGPTTRATLESALRPFLTAT